MLNILTEPLIRMDTAAGRREASLPGVYAALMADEVNAFPALRPHPRHSWHAFLVQLGAMAMHRAGVSEPPSDAAEWAGIIRGMTSDWPDDEPWQLVVDDITKPAFMQPPAGSADKRAEYKNAVATPDALDMLVTAKNHDLKSALASDARPDDWLFALVSLQTMEGFGGAGNYGIARMNGGLGSRPAFSLTPSTRPGAHLKRDLSALLTENRKLLSSSKPGLLWTMAWDGTAAEALTLDKLTPLFIEVCRRVRLRSDADGHLYAIRTSSKAARISAKASNGITQDPWTPIDLRDKKGDKALTLPGGGFNYRRIVDYLNDTKFRLPALVKPTPVERRAPGTMQLVARAMVRGQGKTEGHHERIIPVRSKTRTAMLRPAANADSLGTLANERIEDIAAVQRILAHAIATFAARGDSSNTSPEHRQMSRLWLNRLDEILDANFFDKLQDEIDADERADKDRIRNAWRLDVVGKARRILNDATDALPCPTMFRDKARVSAEGLFEGRLRSDGRLAAIFTEQGDNDD